MVDDRICDVCDLIPGAEHPARPLLILAHDQVVGEGKLPPQPAWHRRVHVGEERLLEARLSPAGVLLHTRVRPIEEVEEVALRRRRVGMWELPTVCTGHTVSSERLDETREPALIRGVGVLAREDEQISAGKARPEVARPAVAERLGGISCTSAPCDLAISALPSVEPESTTRISTSPAPRCRAIASRQRTRSAPPFLTGMTTEITPARRKRRTGTRTARVALFLSHVRCPPSWQSGASAGAP